MRGCNQHEKINEIGGVMHERGQDVMFFYGETKVKGKGEEKFGAFKGVKTGVFQRLRAREGLAIVLKN